MSFLYTLFLALLFSSYAEEQKLNLVTGDKTITHQKINDFLKEEKRSFKYHLQVIKPDKNLDPYIIKEIKDIKKYKIIAIDPRKRRIEKKLTKSLNEKLEFSDIAPSLNDLLKIPALKEK